MLKTRDAMQTLIRDSAKNHVKVSVEFIHESKVSTTPPELIAFYENKTQAIVRRYGPGPRIHYHTGLVEEGPIRDSDPERLRQSLVLSQERLLDYAARIWQFESLAGCEILDVGCGLGGGSLYLAQKFGARVTALTIAPSHAELVRRFAAEVGASHLVIPKIGDALQIPAEHRFDAAIAIDSSSSFPRAPWFHRLAKVLRPNGRILIADCFLEDRKYERPFNAHWCAQIGTLKEYNDAAMAAGFREARVTDLSSKAERFWSLSVAQMDAEQANSQGIEARPSSRVEESHQTHTLVRDGLANGGLRYLLLAVS